MSAFSNPESTNIDDNSLRIALDASPNRTPPALPSTPPPNFSPLLADAQSPHQSPHRQTAPAPKAHPLRVRFLVQNLWCHYAPHCSSPNKKERMTAFLEHLREVDVLLLQEIFLGHGIGKALHRELLHHANLASLPFAALPRTPTVGQNSGLLVISRYPILRQYERDWGGIKEIFPTKKGLLQADLDISPSFLLTVMTLHLSAHSDADRAMQLDEVAVLVEQSRNINVGYPPRHHWFVIAGDFNICPWTQPTEHAHLIDVMSNKLKMHDVFEVLSGEPGGKDGVATCEDNRRIDYFWTNIPKDYIQTSHFAYLPIDNPLIPKISDHMALQVRIEFPS